MTDEQMQTVAELLIDLAKHVSISIDKGTEYSRLLYERTSNPRPGDIVIEVSSFRPDPDRIGVFLGHVPDDAEPDGRVWRVQGLLTGQVHNWGNSDWLAVPTRQIRSQAMKDANQ